MLSTARKGQNPDQNDTRAADIRSSKVYSGVGAGVVYGIITLPPERRVESLGLIERLVQGFVLA